jgi:hypothetical protein
MNVDDFEIAASDAGITDEVMAEISRTVQSAEAEGGFYISEVEVVPIASEGTGTILMQIEPVPAGRKAQLLLRLNENAFNGRTLTELNAGVANSRYIVANSLKEAVWHEIGHAKLISGKSIDEIVSLYEELMPLGIPEISATAAADGAETIAEIEVLLRRGNELPQNALEFYNHYIKRS